ncbi:MAG: ATP-binding cassette domain-containing protein [Motiliproteus sp.]|nr:ATP-binding cassette domain-containing protein [Motiliproteus sp.]MCW9051786.1 ATP-binding cassette domain-containing protein [Motiliproteus sp.]
MTHSPAFQLKDCHQQGNGQTILDIENLSIAAGEKVALIGKSGAGKSTLLNKLRGLRPDECAFCPQHHGLVPALSVYHNIYMGGLERHSTLINLINLVVPRPGSKQDISSLCQQLGLSEKLFISVDQLSGGQQQRTALGRALYQQADLFLGDEPVSAVDNEQAGQLLELLKQQHRTVIIALHNEQLTRNHFDRVIGLKQGRVAMDKPVAEISDSDLADIYRD